MFFRKGKGKYNDVEGYNRISRLIEDRQRELTHGQIDDDDFDEETVLLNREPARERATGRQAERPTAPLGRGQHAAEDESEAVSIQPAATAEERRIPFQAGAGGGVSTVHDAAATQIVNTFEAPSRLDAPRMAVPDLGRTAMQGTLVAAEAIWEGKLVTEGHVRVEGTIRGEIQTGGTLYVIANARIDGTIQARNVQLAGEIEGQIQCVERLEILPGGSARGEITTGKLVVHEGAFIDSRFQMRQAEAPARR